MQYTKIFKASLREVRSIRAIAAIGMLLALSVILSFFTLILTDFLKISFVFIANEMCAMLFGPVAGGIMGALSDIIKYLVKPSGVFFPGFTISGFLGGIIYGVFLYRRPFKVWRVVCANICVTVFVNLLLNTYWLTILYGDTTFGVLFPTRIVKQLVMCPIEIFLYCVIVLALGRTGIFRLFDKQEYFARHGRVGKKATAGDEVKTKFN